jgi:hypothetical protein
LKIHFLLTRQENKIKHDNIENYVLIRGVFQNIWNHLTWEERKKNGILLGIISSLIYIYLFNYYYYKCCLRASVDTEMWCPKGKCGCQYFILLTLNMTNKNQSNWYDWINRFHFGFGPFQWINHESLLTIFQLIQDFWKITIMKTIIFLRIITSVAWGQVWTQKCDVQKASVDVNISYY